MCNSKAKKKKVAKGQSISISLSFFVFVLTDKNIQIGSSLFLFFGFILIKLMQNSTLEWVNCVNDIMRKNGSAANPQLIKLAGGSVSLSAA